ncbi:rab11 protein [Histomonas meleagridis]|uniref:rab11 protein n=1 Tax=Histomonas meleagridis TaxID=135588 RepID=UPI003559522B|nr:rab11 protein [Histomonas meleagridis]KAH0798126.1 rab11 protein [Histomonas meleagridis]
MMKMNIPRFKVILLGNSSVGKTSIVESYTGQFVTLEHCPTVGTGFFPAQVEIKNRRLIFDIWDTAGQEKYRSLVPQYKTGSHGALIVFDVSNKESFESLPTWLEMVKDESPNYVTFLVGNKIDIEEDRTIPEEMIKEFATKNDLRFFECSALTGEGVSEIFMKLFTEIFDKNSTAVPSETIKTLEKKEGGCC